MLATIQASENQNLLKNPDLSKIEDGMPADWILGDVADPENYIVTMQHDVLGESHSVQFVTTMAETSRYLTQDIHLQPGASYEWRVKVYQKAGRGFVWVKAIKDTSGKPISWQKYIFLNSYFGHPLYPNFVSAEKMRGAGVAGWRSEKVAFQMPDNISEVRLSIGVYFSNSDLYIGPMELVQLSAPGEKP